MQTTSAQIASYAIGQPMTWTGLLTTIAAYVLFAVPVFSTLFYCLFEGEAYLLKRLQAFIPCSILTAIGVSLVWGGGFANDAYSILLRLVGICCLVTVSVYGLGLVIATEEPTEPEPDTPWDLFHDLGQP